MHFCVESTQCKDIKNDEYAFVVRCLFLCVCKIYKYESPTLIEESIFSDYCEVHLIG